MLMRLYLGLVECNMTYDLLSAMKIVNITVFVILVDTERS